MIKIKVSYERPEELQRLLEKLQPEIERLKVSGNREGKFLKAYVIMKSVTSQPWLNLHFLHI